MIKGKGRGGDLNLGIRGERGEGKSSYGIREKKREEGKRREVIIEKREAKKVEEREKESR